MELIGKNFQLPRPLADRVAPGEEAWSDLAGEDRELVGVDTHDVDIEIAPSVIRTSFECVVLPAGGRRVDQRGVRNACAIHRLGEEPCSLAHAQFSSQVPDEHHARLELVGRSPRAQCRRISVVAGFKRRRRADPNDGRHRQRLMYPTFVSACPQPIEEPVPVVTLGVWEMLIKIGPSPEERCLVEGELTRVAGHSGRFVQKLRRCVGPVRVERIRGQYARTPFGSGEPCLGRTHA